MKKHVLFFLGLTSIFGSFGQQDEQSSLYMQNPLYYNPAYAGSRQSISLVSLARFQWVGFDGAPMSQWFSVHSPVAGDRLGIGGHFVNDNIGSRNRTAGYLTLSANVQLNKKRHRLALGVSGGADFMSFDFSNLNVTDPNDPYFGQRFTSTKPNLGAGIYYYGDRHFVGISSPRLIEAKLDDANTLISTINQRHFFFTAGGIIPLNSVVQLRPSTMIKYTPNAPLTMDFNASFLFYEKWWFGAMYRFHESVGVNALFRIKDKFQLGYGYDFAINQIRTYQQGTHEILLTYDFNYKKAVYASPRYF